MATLQLSDDAKDVLRRSTVTDESVTLPQEQLERKLYVEVNKALEIMGGKWNRKAKAHLFIKSPKGQLEEILGFNKIEYTDVKKDLNWFETPEWLAKHMIELAEIKETDWVLEPSIGRGGIAKFLPYKKMVQGVEIHEPFANEMRKQGYCVYCTDFLKPIPNTLFQYDVVIMNPPFSRGQDVDHVMQAWEFLKPGGVLITLTCKSWTHNSQKKYIKFRDFVGRYSEHQENIPSGTFKEAGTNIETVLIVLRKPEPIVSIITSDSRFRSLAPKEIQNNTNNQATGSSTNNS